jgi:allophanate hydrolase
VTEASGLNREEAADPAPARELLLGVVAAHRTGQPLHPQLVALGGRFVRTATTAPLYRLLALPGPGVARGGLMRVDGDTGHDGAGVEVELHALPLPALGSLVEVLPPPLAVGRIGLDDASWVVGMICTHRPAGALDVTEYGSWPAYLAVAGGAGRP